MCRKCCSPTVHKCFIYYYKLNIIVQEKEFVCVWEWVSEWVSECVLLDDNSAFVQLYHGESKLIFNEMMMKSALY